MPEHDIRAAFFDFSVDLMAVADLEGRLVDVNDAFERTLGFPREELVGRPITDLIHPEDAEATRIEVGKLFEDVPTDATWVNRYRDAGGAYHVLRWTTRVDFERRLMFGIARDVTHERDFDERLTHAAHHDHLTGVANRKAFFDALAVGLRRAERSNQMVGVVLVDLDGFKEVNDLHGHAAGDAVLRAAARRLQDVTRQGDVVARLGGDEFAIVLPDVGKHHAVAQRACDRVVRAAEAALVLGVPYEGVDLHVSASFGIALSRGDQSTAEALVRAADAALYAAKAERVSTTLT